MWLSLRILGNCFSDMAVLTGYDSQPASQPTSQLANEWKNESIHPSIECQVTGQKLYKKMRRGGIPRVQTLKSCPLCCVSGFGLGNVPWNAVNHFTFALGRLSQFSYGGLVTCRLTSPEIQDIHHQWDPLKQFPILFWSKKKPYDGETPNCSKVRIFFCPTLEQ